MRLLFKVFKIKLIFTQKYPEIQMLFCYEAGIMGGLALIT